MINLSPINKYGKILLLTLIAFSFYSLIIHQKNDINIEICDNGIDDDNDGLIDLNDDDCECETVNYQSMIPNPSFELYSCCPHKTEQMECVTDWSQASSATTDYMNLCDWIDVDFFTPPIPFPDGKGVIRIINGTYDEQHNYKEYAGVCLNSPMRKDSTYQFEFYLGFLETSNSPDLNIAFYGSSTCDNLPFTTGIEFDCPSKYLDWTLLNSKLVTNDGGNQWKKVTLTITPERDIYAIAVGPDCQRVDVKSYYYFLDNFILIDIDNFDFVPLEMVSPCSNDFRFGVRHHPNFQYQWYKEGIALVGETTAELSQMYGEGAYQLRIVNGTNCRISEDYIYSIPVYRDTFSIQTCEREGYLFGDKILNTNGTFIDTFSTIDGCDSIVTINLVVKETVIDTLSITLLQGTSFQFHNRSFTSAGNHFVTLKTHYGCDSIINLKIEHSKVYIPNAFSPNVDGINDIFKIYGAENEIATVEMFIYDRWGNQLFSGIEWDGTAKGKSLQTGVYVYVVQITTTLGENIKYAGSVTLMQ